MLNVGQFTMVLYTTLCPMADHHCYAMQVQNSDTQQVQRISSAGAAFLRFPHCFPVHSSSRTVTQKERTLLGHSLSCLTACCKTKLEPCFFLTGLLHQKQHVNMGNIHKPIDLFFLKSNWQRRKHFSTPMNEPTWISLQIAEKSEKWWQGKYRNAPHSIVSCCDHQETVLSTKATRLKHTNTLTLW